MFLRAGTPGATHPKGQVWRRATAIFVILVFTLFDAVRYAPQGYASPVTTVTGPAPAFFTIPKELGKIDEVYFATTDQRPQTTDSLSRGEKDRVRGESRQSPISSFKSGKTVIFIQDAHDSLEAQENIAKIINHLVSNYGVKTVFEEGYEGPVPTDNYFGFIKDPKIKEKVSYFLMDHLRVGGAEYAHINRAKDFNLLGADSIKLHKENIGQYRLSAAKKDDITKDLKALDKELKSLADARFPKALKEWLKTKEQFDAKKLDLFTYLGRTMPLLGKHGAEKGLGLISFILEAIRSSDPAVIEKAKRIDAREVFTELIKLEQAVAETYLHDGADKQLFGYYELLALLRRLNDLQVSQEEYEAVKASLRAFDTDSFARFIFSQAPKTLILSRMWERNIKEAIKFYEKAKERDHSLESALDKYLAVGTADQRPATKDSLSPGERIGEGESLQSLPRRQAGPVSGLQSPKTRSEVAVLVFGGFHKENIKRILEAKGISYLVVSPRITKPSPRHEQFYKQLMTVGRLSYELPASLRVTARAETWFEIGKTNPAWARTELRILSDVARQTDSSVFGPAAEQALKTFGSHNPGRSEMRGTLFMDSRAKNVRALTEEEDRVLNAALDAVAFKSLEEGGTEFLTDGKARKLLEYHAMEEFSEENVTPEIRVIDEEALKKALGPEYQYLAEGWITHTGTWRGDPMGQPHANIFLPHSIYEMLEDYRDHSWLAFWRENVLRAFFGDGGDAPLPEDKRNGYIAAFYRDRLERIAKKEKENAERESRRHRDDNEGPNTEDKQERKNADVDFGFDQYTEAFELKRLFTAVGASEQAVRVLGGRLSQPYRRNEDVLGEYAVQREFAGSPGSVEQLMKKLRELESLVKSVAEQRHRTEESQQAYDALTETFKEVLLPGTGKLPILLKELEVLLEPYTNSRIRGLREYINEVLGRYDTTFSRDSRIFQRHEYEQDVFGRSFFSNAPQLGRLEVNLLSSIIMSTGDVAFSATLAILRIKQGYKEVTFTTGGALFKMTNARHPVLKLKGEFQPVSFEMPAEGKAVLISGLNTGGKSVTLKTAGIIALMIQCGIPVPADVMMDEGMFAGFSKPDINPEDVGIGEASRFAAELGTSGRLMRTLRSRTFAIIDDDMFGGASEPAVEASGFAATVESLSERNVAVIAVTHHIDALEALRKRHPDYLFRRIKTKPGADGADETTYSLEDGIAGSSQGLHETVRQNWPGAARAVAYYNMLRKKRTEAEIVFQGLKGAKPQKPAKYRGYFYSKAEQINLETWQFGNTVYAVALATLGSGGAYEAKEFVDQMIKKPEAADSRLWRDSIETLKASQVALRELESKLRANMQDWERKYVADSDRWGVVGYDRKPAIKEGDPVAKAFLDLVAFAENSDVPVLRENGKVIRAFIEDKTRSSLFMYYLASQGLEGAVAMVDEPSADKSKRAVVDNIRALFAISALARFSWPFASSSAGRGEIDIEGGWHSTLTRTPKRTPSDIHIKPNGNEGSLSIYTGFNTGGKSTLAKMIAQIVTLARMGWPIPARAAVIGDFSDIQVVSGTLTEEKQRSHSRQHKSAIGGALAAALHESALVIQSATPKTLVILDEPFSGATEPSVAAALTAALAEELTRRGATVILITHLLESVPLLVERVPYAKTYKAKTMIQNGVTVPLYSFEPGIALSSHGFEVAKQMQWPGLEKALTFFDLLTEQAQGRSEMPLDQYPRTSRSEARDGLRTEMRRQTRPETRDQRPQTEEQFLGSSLKSQVSSLKIRSEMRSEMREITEPEVSAALDEINREAGKMIFNEKLKQSIARKITSLKLVRGKTALVMGPGSGDKLSLLLEKLGLKSWAVEPDEDSVTTERIRQRIHGKVSNIVSDYAELGNIRFDYVFCFAVLTEALMGNNAVYYSVNSDLIQKRVENITKRKIWDILEPALARLNPEGGFLFVNSFGFGDPHANEPFYRDTFTWMEFVIRDPEGGNLLLEKYPEMDVSDLCLVPGNLREPRNGAAYRLTSPKAITPEAAPPSGATAGSADGARLRDADRNYLGQILSLCDPGHVIGDDDLKRKRLYGCLFGGFSNLFSVIHTAFMNDRWNDLSQLLERADRDLELGMQILGECSPEKIQKSMLPVTLEEAMQAFLAVNGYSIVSPELYRYWYDQKTELAAILLEHEEWISVLRDYLASVRTHLQEIRGRLVAPVAQDGNGTIEKPEAKSRSEMPLDQYPRTSRSEARDGLRTEMRGQTRPETRDQRPQTEDSLSRGERIGEGKSLQSLPRRQAGPVSGLQSPKTRSEVAVLVFGGFHKENIKRILEAKGISYFVASPHITKLSPRHEEFYKRLMTDGHHTFEMPFLVSHATRPLPLVAEDEPIVRAELRAVYDALLAHPEADLKTLDRYLTAPKRSEVRSNVGGRKEIQDQFVIDDFTNAVKALRKNYYASLDVLRWNEAEHIIDLSRVFKKNLYGLFTKLFADLKIDKDIVLVASGSVARESHVEGSDFDFYFIVNDSPEALSKVRQVVDVFKNASINFDSDIIPSNSFVREKLNDDWDENYSSVERMPFATLEDVEGFFLNAADSFTPKMVGLLTVEYIAGDQKLMENYRKVINANLVRHFKVLTDFLIAELQHLSQMPFSTHDFDVKTGRGMLLQIHDIYWMLLLMQGDDFVQEVPSFWDVIRKGSSVSIRLDEIIPIMCFYLLLRNNIVRNARLHYLHPTGGETLYHHSEGTAIVSADNGLTPEALEKRILEYSDRVVAISQEIKQLFSDNNLKMGRVSRSEIRNKTRSEIRKSKVELSQANIPTPITPEIRSVASVSNVPTFNPWQVLRLKQDVIAVVEQSKIDALSPEMFKELLEIAGLNSGKLHLVIPDALQGKYSARVTELRKVASIYYGFPRLAASDKIPVIGFSDMERDTLAKFQGRLDPRLAGRVKDSAFGLNQAGSFGVGILYALKDIPPDQLRPNQNGFRYDATGRYSAQVLEVLQAYTVISTSA